MNHNEILQDAYSKAEACLNSAGRKIKFASESIRKDLDRILERGEANKGLLAVLITLITHKIHSPSQDIRYHQAQLEGGFAGRGIDSTYVTPFMKEHEFPAMADSGWLTRSLEQPHPYTLDYPGKIKPDFMKSAFLNVVDAVEKGTESSPVMLEYVFMEL